MLSQQHYIQLPREVLVGSGVLALLGETCLRLGFTGSALVVTGEKTYEVAGRKTTEALIDGGLSVEHITVERATLDQVKLVEDRVRKVKPSVVLGVGGGKDIDVAKLGSVNGRTRFISVPTAASHDGIMSSYASIKGLEKPYSIRAQAPIAIIADLDIIAASPHRLIASGCGDMVAKYTANKDWRLAQKRHKEDYEEYAANLALLSAKLVMRNASSIRERNIEGIRTIVEALINCGISMNIAGSTRGCSGSEHLFSHALDLLAPNPAFHGEQCGVGAILSAYLHGANWKLVRDVLKIAGAPTTARQMGIDAEYVIKALTLAAKLRPERYTVFNEINLTVEKAEETAKVTGVVD
ncbi:NAD(P)-dependent glycerol-1-phosphate dehydrogenase [Chloroflexota bacterium]